MKRNLSESAFCIRNNYTLIHLNPHVMLTFFVTNLVPDKKKGNISIMTLFLLLLLPTISALDDEIYDIFADGDTFNTLDTTTTSSWSTFSRSTGLPHQIDTSQCDLPIVPSSSLGSIDWNQPFLTPRPSWPSDTTWSSKSFFLQKYGQTKWMTDAPQFFSYQGYSILTNTLQDYVDGVLDKQHQKTTATTTAQQQQEMLRHGTIDQYAFSSFQASEWPEMTNDTRRSTASDNNNNNNNNGDPFRMIYEKNTKSSQHQRHSIEQVAIGSTGSGLSWHRHSAAWNSVVVGQKLWFFSNPNIDPPEGLESNRKKKKNFTFTVLRYFLTFLFHILLTDHSIFIFVSNIVQFFFEDTSLSWFRKHGLSSSHVLRCVVKAKDQLYVYVPDKCKKF